VSRPFEVHLPLEQGFVRHSLFAIELLDAVTLSRVSQGIKVVAEGLYGKPTLNAGGIFVWREEPIERLKKVRIDPGALPYEMVERDKAQLQLPPAPAPLTTIELPPRLDYAFVPGITGARGTLIEERVSSPEPVRQAEVRFLWLDDDGVTWRDAPTTSHTNGEGDFVSILRFGPTDVPRLNASKELTVRLWVRRDSTSVRRSAGLLLPQGRISDRSTARALRFAWDELLP
jgi:hypothetical protein